VERGGGRRRGERDGWILPGRARRPFVQWSRLPPTPWARLPFRNMRFTTWGPAHVGSIRRGQHQQFFEVCQERGGREVGKLAFPVPVALAWFLGHEFHPRHLDRVDEGSDDVVGRGALHCLLAVLLPVHWASWRSAHPGGCKGVGSTVSGGQRQRA
jgi:hypothetical protein